MENLWRQLKAKQLAKYSGGRTLRCAAEGYKIPQELAALPTFFGSGSERLPKLQALPEGAGIDNIVIPQTAAAGIGGGTLESLTDALCGSLQPTLP